MCVCVEYDKRYVTPSVDFLFPFSSSLSACVIICLRDWKESWLLLYYDCFVVDLEAVL